jgi:hypothetical protein
MARRLDKFILSGMWLNITFSCGSEDGDRLQTQRSGKGRP